MFPTDDPPMARGGGSSTRDAAYGATGVAAVRAGPKVAYDFRGTALVVGTGARALEIADRLKGELAVVAVLADRPEDAGPHAGMRVMRGRVVEVAGHLGKFTAKAEGRDGPIDLGRFSENRYEVFDLVVDAGDTALMTTEVLPIGYYRADVGDNAVERIRADLPEFRDGLKRPRLLRYRPDLCAHSRQGVEGCIACLSACPAGALASSKGRIEVDFHLCQGCSSCTTVCPTGALSRSFPTAASLRERLREMMDTRHESGVEAGVIVFHEGSADDVAGAAAEPRLSHVLPFAVDALGIVGMETCLAALAGGAAGVVLLADGRMPATVRGAVAREVLRTQEIIAALGHDPARVRMVAAEEWRDRTCGPLPGAHPGPVTRTPFAETRDKRKTSWLAIDYLARNGTPSANAPALSAGMPFGEVRVDQDACTMCLACVALCPTGALRSGANGMELLFVEEACMQCAICARGCPENAVDLAPRLLLDAEARGDARRLVLLDEARLARCLTCGEPFMPQAMLDAILRHLGEGAEADDRATRSVRTCPACRARSTLERQIIAGAPDPSDG